MDRRRLIAATLAALLPAAASAGVSSDVPSCYAANAIAPAGGLAYSRLIYVLIDQTVTWPPELQAAIVDNLNANLTPGTKFVIAAFSAYADGRYLDVLHTGIVEAPMPPAQVANTAIQKTRIFDACLAGQRPYATSLADGATVAALQDGTSSLAHSDIMAALQAVSAPIKADPGPQKLLLLASDGLENSGATSFYRHGAIRDIDPAAELAHAETLFGDFGGAKAYVIGGALPPPGQTAAYRPPKLLHDIADFWRRYFARSNAQLVEFGEPALLEPVHF